MGNFLTPGLWFGMYAGPLTPLFRNILVGIIIAFLLLFAFSTIQYRKNKKNLYRRVWNSLYSFSVTGFILGVALLFFTSQRIPFFSMRLWFALWALLHIVWAYLIYQKYQQIPEIEQELAKKREFKKYTP